MSAAAFQEVIDASPQDREGLFLATAQRLGTTLGNVEKDFWMCWTLDVLYHRLPPGGPRLLFKGGTSLSKAYGLISRFSEDIDVTVYRTDLGEAWTVEDLEVLTNKQRQVKLEAIRAACHAFVAGSLLPDLQEHVTAATSGAGHVIVDETDAHGQTLLVRYPTSAAGAADAYVHPVVRIESGAKSALDPNRLTTLRPYVMDDLPNLDLAVPDITTIEPARTFWDKVVIAHGLRRWYERRGAWRQEGQRLSRHYYDLHCLFQNPVGPAALTDARLGADCVRHARMFFDRPDYDLSSARAGTFALRPVPGMVDSLTRDFRAMEAMIFGTAPDIADVLASIEAIEEAANASPAHG